MTRRHVVISLVLHVTAFGSVVGVKVTNQQNRVDSRAPNTDKGEDGPVALGCFRTEDSSPSLPLNLWEDRDEMSLALCVQHCAINENALSGVQNGYMCWCSDLSPYHAIQPSTFCMIACAGSTEKCGGRYTISVYTICPPERYGPSCELSCFCYQKYPCHYVTGKCLNERCQPLYEGLKCDYPKSAMFTKLVNSWVGMMKTAWKFVKSYFVVDEQKIPETCEGNLYGPTCEESCHCIDNGHCDRVSGVCDNVTAGCASGWLGKRCNLGDPCSSNPCQNKGLCTTVGLKVKCDCGREYSGTYCQYANRCSNSPCQNGGTCRSLSMGRYKCECAGVFYGDDCENDADKLPETHKYAGCFREFDKKLSFPTQMTGYDADNMTIGKCAKKCKTRSFTYSGLKKGTECWCSNAYGHHGALPEGECSEKCSGNEEQSCGGVDDNIISVYMSCPVGYYKMDCKGMCNCLYEQCRLDNGKCEQILCKVGWEGEKCELGRGESNQSLREAIKNILYILMAYAILVFAGSFANGFKHLQETAEGKKRMETFKEARINQEMEKIKAEMKQRRVDEKNKKKEVKKKDKEKKLKKREMKLKDKEMKIKEKEIKKKEKELEKKEKELDKGEDKEKSEGSD